MNFVVTAMVLLKSIHATEDVNNIRIIHATVICNADFKIMHSDSIFMKKIKG